MRGGEGRGGERRGGGRRGLGASRAGVHDPAEHALGAQRGVRGWELEESVGLRGPARHAPREVRLGHRVVKQRHLGKDSGVGVRGLC